MQSSNKWSKVGFFGGLIFGLIFFSTLIGLVLFSVVRDYIEINKLHRSGVIAQGIVFTREVAHDPEAYFITYQFTPEKGARWFTGTGYVSQATYKTARPGQPVTIIYVRDEPTISRLQGEDHYADTLGFFVFMLFMEMVLLLIAIIIVWVQVKSLLVKWKLRRE
jgi:hypothetical protein